MTNLTCDAATRWQPIPQLAGVIAVMLCSHWASTQTSPVVDATKFAGVDAGAKIAAAEASLPRGGIVDARNFGATTQTISDPLAVGSSTSSITLLVDRMTRYNITVTSGADAICIDNGSALMAEGAGAGRTISGFRLASDANVASLLAPCHKDGTQETFTARGLVLVGSPTAMVPTLVDLPSVFVNSSFSDNVVECFPKIGVHVHNGGNGLSFGPMLFSNNWINGLAGCKNPDARPVVIDNAGRRGMVGGITWTGGAVEHQGTGNPLVEITGTPGGEITNVTFIGTYLENRDPTGHGFVVTNARGILLDGVYGGGVPSSGDFIQINGSSSYTSVSVYRAMDAQPVFRNIVHNTIVGYSSGQNALGLRQYEYGGL